MDISNFVALETDHIDGYLGAGVSLVDYNDDDCDEFIYGFSYIQAFNYSSDATFDDGTSEIGCLCCDGIIWDVQQPK